MFLGIKVEHSHEKSKNKNGKIKKNDLLGK